MLSDIDEYEGGDLEIARASNFTRDQHFNLGTIIVFPSYMSHKVHEVTKGVRYTLTSWIEGPSWA